MGGTRFTRYRRLPLNQQEKPNKMSSARQWVVTTVLFPIDGIRRAVCEYEGLGARLLVIERGPDHGLPLWVKSASKSDW